MSSFGQIYQLPTPLHHVNVLFLFFSTFYRKEISTITNLFPFFVVKVFKKKKKHLEKKFQQGKISVNFLPCPSDIIFPPSNFLIHRFFGCVAV